VVAEWIGVGRDCATVRQFKSEAIVTVLLGFIDKGESGNDLRLAEATGYQQEID
jgi:hypothetical protein